MTDREPLDEALARLTVPPLDARFAARVQAMARAELGRSERPAPAPSRPRLALGAALIPALLTLAAVVETATTTRTIIAIYGKPAEAYSK